jgi:fatty aldehyde-generating acyl-ACP reductase
MASVDPATIRRSDFAVIGHLETWELIFRYFREITKSNERRLDDATVAELYSYVPPRVIFRLRVTSTQGKDVHGVYVETFIPPSELDRTFLRRNLDKVKRAAERAQREGARVASLGGFASILIEGNIGRILTDTGGCAYNTGNTLTAALITRGVREACRVRNKPLNRATLLVIGSTGDIGSGCVLYFKDKVAQLLLCARDQARLQRQEQELSAQGIACRRLPEVEAVAVADVIIYVASVPTPTFLLKRCKPDAIVCDAGYPKNVRLDAEDGSQRVFFGGMGLVMGGWESDPPFLPRIFGFPDTRIAHGCMIEPILLAFAGRYESFSRGRGNITAERIHEMWSLAAEHGIQLAPLFNHNGVWHRGELSSDSRARSCD